MSEPVNLVDAIARCGPLLHALGGACTALGNNSLDLDLAREVETCATAYRVAVEAMVAQIKPDAAAPDAPSLH